MDSTEFFANVTRSLPELQGKLTMETVRFYQKQNKAQFSFLSSVIVGEDEYLKLERAVAAEMPKLIVSIRVASPSLGADFLKEPEKYKDVFQAFLLRAYPAIAAWIGDIVWSPAKDGISLTFPDDFSRSYFEKNALSARLRQAVYDIFRLDVKISLIVNKSEEDILKEYLEERSLNEQLAAEKAQAEEQQALEEKLKTRSKIIKGSQIAQPSVPINELNETYDRVVIEGEILSVESKETKSGEMMICSFGITDYTSSIKCKVFLRYHPKQYGRKKDQPEESDAPQAATDEERKAVADILSRITQGSFVRVRGKCEYSSYDKELVFSVNDINEIDKPVRLDTAEEKRVELHMHTKMSTMDGLSSASDLIAQAAAWGHKAVAITDHGVVQAFPEAFGAAKKNKIKLIPGVEGYLVDDQMILTGEGDRDIEDTIVVLDFETTGLDPRRDRVIEIGAVKLRAGQLEDSLSVMVNPGVPLPQKVMELTGITEAMVQPARSAADEIPALMEFVGDAPIAAHNANFDVSFLKNELKRLGRDWDGLVVDTLAFARKQFPQLASHKLKAVCKNLHVSLKDAHRAVNDAQATAKCLAQMYAYAKEKGAKTLCDLDGMFDSGAIGESWHIILLAKNQQGMENLNRIVSDAHLNNFRRRPHVRRDILQKYREGLIVGSACEAGELYRAVLGGVSNDKLRKIARFYDYLEIQPVGNNEFLVREGRVRDDDELREINRRIVALGDELGIPTVATGDVHFKEPKDSIFRAIIQASQGFDDADNQAPLYFKPTQEMLEEFAYLGKDKCYEVVIKNPNMIADKVDNIRLFPEHPKGETTFQPLWEEAAHDIETMSWGTAHEWYGEELPDIINKRLEKELHSIVGYGFSTLYSIAQKLVSKSNLSGYLVGSRGSVGSSFVATMCGITEVNPLPPHYRCETCHKGFFDVPEGYTVGVDLPDKDCPLCGKPLKKDGFDIPFEVFLGFKGDKVPDIDLNFSGEYQAKAHKNVEELFGKGHVFRAGTISGVAEKTAYGYVLKYLEERHIENVPRAEKERLAAGCVGVKRTTGQHPGGMVVVPKEYDIYQFTAVQHPADDLDCGIVTTHYDFNSMHDILVKLDCLGHDDPTVQHMLKEITGVDPRDVPLDDPPVRSLFTSPKALGVTAEQIDCTTGTLGIPEFGTAFVRKMLEDTRPSTMEELIRISGLSHGTNVWNGNAQDLVKAGTATLRECICTRDDIMNHLISIGVPDKMAFDTMEFVRKGKGLKPEMEQAMVEHGVEPWYPEACRKIGYMFPKGHAVAYVTSALRIAYFKVHYPKAYYATYFTIRGDGFDSSRMVTSADKLRAMLAEKRQEVDDKKTDSKTSATDKEEIVALELCLEMSMRGIKFLPVDIYKSEVKEFTIEDEGIRCPFISLPGLGEAAAQSVVEARKERQFISVEDIKGRCKISGSLLDLLRDNGALGSLPDTSQVSLFSMF